VTADAASIRRFAGLSLVGGLCVAAVAAVLALLTGSFGDVDLRVVLSSMGFALFSATGSTGAGARLRPSDEVRLLGSATLAASIAAFVLLLVGLWTNIDDWGSEGVWRSFGCVGVLAVAGSHACVMLGARRRADSEAVRLLTLCSLGLSAFDTLAVILPIAGLIEDVDEPWPNIFGAGLVLLVLTSILPPILRKLESAPAAESANGSADAADEFLAAAVIRIADRIDELNSDPGNRAPEIRAEVDRLRKLAQSYES
jgi:hypothetical protein